MGGEGKLREFLEWVASTGVADKALTDFRRIAVELTAQASGGRVTESHILHLIDQYSDGPGGHEATSMIEEVGEAMLRFQASRPMPAPSVPAVPVPSAPARAPSAPIPPAAASTSAPPVSPSASASFTPVQGIPLPVALSNSTPVRGLPAAPIAPNRTPSQPFVTRPEDRVASELMPPAVPRHTPPEQPVVSFASATGEAPRRSRGQRDSSRRSGFQFRCPACRIMVTADDKMACPRCGRLAPQIQPTRAARPRHTNWLLPIAVAAVALIVLVLVAPIAWKALRDHSEPVGGVYASPHLGVRLQFPDGWRHATDSDWAPTATPASFAAVIPESISMRKSRFKRQGATLLLLVAARPSQVSDAAFAAWADAAAPEIVGPGLRELSGVKDLRLNRCTAGAMVPRSGLRCAGEGQGRRVLAYVFGTRAVTVVAVFLSTDTAEGAQAEADELIAGLDVS